MELKSHVVQNLVRASPTWILKSAQNVWTSEIPQTILKLGGVLGESGSPWTPPTWPRTPPQTHFPLSLPSLSSLHLTRGGHFVGIVGWPPPSWLLVMSDR
uniref:Uncharacterized protein n=1 Tax=Aegilops tauschii subsp. strangulata TaxID=200361 RepID=A0A453FFP3_AEGTS